MSRDYEKLKKTFKNDPEMLDLLEKKENKAILKKLADDTTKDNAIEIALLLKKGDKGDTGENGADGYTPKKGTDYFTEEEVRDIADFIKESVKDEVRPIKGVDYFDGIDADEDRIVQAVMSKMPTLSEIASSVELPEQQKINKEELMKELVEKLPKHLPLTIDEIVKEIKSKQLLELRDIRGARLDRGMNMNDQRWHGGGLSNITGLITAGNNITITGSGTTADPYVINSIGVASGVESINGDTTAAQTLAIGTAGTDFAIVDNGTGTHTFNLPTASALNRGALSSADWSAFNAKVDGSGTTNEITYWVNGTTLGALAVATYPSLTELSYVKGVTSSIQTQLNGKQATITPAALSKTDDTNVTLLLGGSPTVALLAATSLTLGWTGTLSLARGGSGASLSDPGFNAVWVWDDTTNATRLAQLSGISYDSGTNTLTASGTPISFGTDNQIPYMNAAGNNFDYSSSLLFDGAKMTLIGAGTGQVGALNITRGDSVNQYIVLQESGASAGSAYLTFAGSNPGAMAMGVLFTAGVPVTYVFTDTGGVPLVSIDEATGALNVANLTASEIVATDGSKNLQSLAVATYPSLTELSYVKGVTSGIQAQLNAKAAALSGTINEIAYFNTGTTIASLAVATYPSLTELSYVKGVTSAIQTQLNAKGAIAGQVWTGVHDFGGATSLEIPNSAAPTVDADGEIAFDTTVADFSTGVIRFFGIEEQGIVAMPIAQFTAPQDGYVVSYNATNDEFELRAVASGVPTQITVANEATDTSCFIGFFTAATGDLGPKTNVNLTFDSSTGILTLGQTASASITGNAGTATALQNSRTIGGVSFDGTANITVATATGGFTVSGGNLALGTNSITMTGSLGATGARVLKGWFTDLEVTNAIAGSITGNAATVTVANEATDTTCFIGFFTDASGSLAPKTNTNMTFNSNTGVATFASTILTTTDINGGTIDATVIGGATPAAGTFTTHTSNNLLASSNDSGAIGASGTAFSDLFLASGGIINWNAGNATLTHSASLLTSNVDISVPDEAYGSGWNGSTEVPTKNALYDKIETLTAPDYNRISGTAPNSTVKTYFTIQSIFELWTGAVVNDTTTTKVNWVRNSTDITVPPLGYMAQFGGTGADSIRSTGPFRTSGSTTLQADSTNIIIMDWWAKLPASSTGDINMGFGFADTDDFTDVYNSSSGAGRVVFSMRGSTGVIYATIMKNGVGVTNTDVSSGITNTNWNNFRIEYDCSNNAVFYINGTSVATLSGANLPSAAWSVDVGFGRSNTAEFVVTAPAFSMQMNP